MFLKRISTILLLTLFILPPLYSEQDIPKIGLVDSSKIISTYFQDSKVMRELKELKAAIIAESNSIKDEILELKRKKLEAERRSQQEEVLRLENLIQEKERFLKEYLQVKNQEYKKRQEAALEDTFLMEITEAIEYIAVSEGYSVILEKQNPIFLYYAVDIDITEKVLKHLLEKAGKGF